MSITAKVTYHEVMDSDDTAISVELFAVTKAEYSDDARHPMGGLTPSVLLLNFAIGDFPRKDFYGNNSEIFEFATTQAAIEFYTNAGYSVTDIEAYDRWLEGKEDRDEDDLDDESEDNVAAAAGDN